MTNEQAITKLQQYLDSNLIEDLTGNEGVDEAIRMGVDALKQPEIIYCKDCKHLEVDSIFHDCWCMGRKVWATHYCGYAERRTNG